jgi:hypothetical protein
MKVELHCKYKINAADNQYIFCSRENAVLYEIIVAKLLKINNFPSKSIHSQRFKIYPQRLCVIL